MSFENALPLNSDQRRNLGTSLRLLCEDLERLLFRRPFKRPNICTASWGSQPTGRCPSLARWLPRLRSGLLGSKI